MAVLQAARAHALGLPLESAQSWGLNRAIFYAAAKRGFKGHGAGSPTKVGKRPSGAQRSLGTDEYYLGDELAHKSVSSSQNKPIFEIGGKTQTGSDFERQIKTRFGDSFDEAWRDALDYVGHFDKGVLESQSGFFSDVYRPKRDEFAAKWSESAAPSAGTEPKARSVKGHRSA